MRDNLLQYLTCPDCAGDLTLSTSDRSEGGEVISGELLCSRCRHGYPIRDGIPRFADLRKDAAQRSTALNFGAQWLVFDQLEQHYEKQFLDWIAPITPDFVRGKVVLEGGCGKGRHTRLIGEWGAREIIGVDFSEAVEAAYRNTKDLPNVHIIQADIYRLPLKQSFEYAFSVGVLHHLPDPQAGFAALIKHLKPGGAISTWVYGCENNGWIIKFINPLRIYLTSKLPPRVLYYLSYLPASVLFLLLKTVYLPVREIAISRYLFYADYLGYIAGFPFKEIHSIVHDHLTAPIAFYISREEFGRWFEMEQTEHSQINWHNRNSWRGLAFTRSTSDPK
ncbi:MAG: methyltransferase domain-containing protein [Acidobacteria bacterium]|nr:methyltransferase domain-containing protein [Acidobacteriota bacterium]